MKKHIWSLVIFLFAYASCSLNAQQWHVLLYMDSTDNLADMAIKNLTDALRAQVNEQVVLKVQLHAYSNIGLRYQITSHGLCFEESVILSGNSKDDLIAAGGWAFNDVSPDDHTMLIFWNHGWGTLDPEWNEDKQEWEAVQGLEGELCPISERSYGLHEDTTRTRVTRGFMFSAAPRVYLDNQAMSGALSHITSTCLRGKKINVVAFDTCMGGMLEVGYQVAPYAQYLVGNQVCALPDGFDYYGVVSALKKGLLPRALAQEMVRIFETYYTEHDKRGVYAHTALDLSCIDSVTQALDAIACKVLECESGISAALQAHDHTPRFCLFPMYTDVISYMQTLERYITQDEMHLGMQTAIAQLQDAIKNFVVARCAGYSNEGKVHGCAFYVPQYEVHGSYALTRFARDTHWAQLLQVVASAAV